MWNFRDYEKFWGYNFEVYWYIGKKKNSRHEILPIIIRMDIFLYFDKKVTTNLNSFYHFYKQQQKKRTELNEYLFQESEERKDLFFFDIQ